MKNYPKIFLLLLLIFLCFFIVEKVNSQDVTPPTGTLNVVPTEFGVNSTTSITVGGEDDNYMFAVCYWETSSTTPFCYGCTASSSSCGFTFPRQETVLGMHTYYGIVFDTALPLHNSGFTDPASINVNVVSSPTISTNAATDIQATQAALNGNLNNLGGAGSVDVWFQFGTSTAYGQETTHLQKNTTGGFSITATGLTQNQIYHFRAAAKNGAGTSYGQDQNFKTFIELIVNGGFETGDLTGWQTTGTGDHLASNEEKQAGDYSGLIGYKTNPLVANGKSILYQDINIPSASKDVTFSLWYKFFSFDICPYDYLNIYLKNTGGSILKTYLEYCFSTTTQGQLKTTDWKQITDDLSAYAGQSVRIYFEVENRADTFHRSWVYLDDISVKYRPVYSPAVTTLSASGVLPTQIVLNGSLDNMGEAYTVNTWFQWGTTTGYGSQTSSTTVNSTGTFSATINSLSPDTVYNFRAVASNGTPLVYGSNKATSTLHAAAGGWLHVLGSDPYAIGGTLTDESSTWQSMTAIKEYSSDGDITSSALNHDADNHTPAGYRGFLIFNVSSSTMGSLKCSQIRVSATGLNTPIGTTTSDIDILYHGTSTWTHIFEGILQKNHDWVVFNLNPPLPDGKIDKARFRFYYFISGDSATLDEFQFYKVPQEQTTLPVVVTTEASSVEENSAVLHGLITNDGGETNQFRFQYGLTSSYGSTTNWDTNINIGSGETFGKMIKGLQVGQTYHFMAQVKNSTGTASGADKTFFTQSAQAGWVSPTDFYDAGAGSASEWQSEENAFDDEVGTYFYTRSLEAEGNRESVPLELWRQPISSDKIRFYARGQISVGTSTVGDVSSSSIEVYKDGNWSKIFNGFFPNKTWQEVSFPGGIVSKARIQLHMLRSGDYAYYQLYELDFYKKTEQAQVATYSATGTTKNSTNLYGNLLNLGGAPSTQVWFQWGLYPGPYTSTTASTSKSTTGLFNTNISGLTPTSTYHFKAFANNGVGDSSGTDMIFSTPGSCTSGQIQQCSILGCITTTTCNNGSWPECPRVACTRNATGTQECPCLSHPPNGCYNMDFDPGGIANDWVSFPDYGNCSDTCGCNIGIAPGQPCAPQITFNATTTCNQPPYTPTNPQVEFDQCWRASPTVNDGLVVTFRWNYSDPELDPQASYDVQLSLDTDPSFLNSKFNFIPEISVSSPSYVLNLRDDPSCTLEKLEWNKTYYWRTRVKDNVGGSWSQWATSSFQTPVHSGPYANFEISPPNPPIKAPVTLIDESFCYSYLNASSSACRYRSPATVDYLWDLGNGSTSTHAGDIFTSFPEAESYTITLKITDKSFDPDLTCSFSSTTNAVNTIPLWKETPPF